MRDAGGGAIRGLAGEAVKLYGDSLVGNVVLTPKVGHWPGGLCEIIEMNPDPNAPEIVFTVKRTDGTNDEIGVFEDEEVELYPQGIGSTLKETIDGQAN